jgi:serine/threonine protein kinase
VTCRLNLEKCGGHPIAGGGFGDVYEGMLIGDKKVAIKCARLYLRNGNDGFKVLKVCTVLNSLVAPHRLWYQRAAHELYTWSSLKHENIVELVGLAQFQGQISMVSPWMENGPLPEYISRHPEVDRISLVGRWLRLISLRAKPHI